MDFVGMGCAEDAITWVPSGRWISFSGPVPVAVLDAPPVSGFHLVHIDAAQVSADVVTKALRNEPLDILAAMVHVPTGLALSLEAAMTRADQLGLPTLVRAPELLGLSNSRVVPFHAHGEVGAVLVIPAEHLASVRYRLTEKWASEQLGSYDPAVAERLRHSPKMTDIEPAEHITRGKPEAYAAALREHTARLVELVRHYDAALIPPGPRRSESSRPIVATRLDARGPLRPLQERDERATHPAEPEAVRLVAVGTTHVVVRQVTTGGRRQFVLVSDQEWAELASRDLVPPGRAPALVVHSVTGGDVHVPVRYADGTQGMGSLGAPDLAMVMKTMAPDADSWVFASCAAGAGNGGFAAKLADALEDRDVLAPQGDVWVGANITGGLSTWQGKSWRLFVPGGSDGEGWDVVNDPVDDGLPFDGITALPDESNSGIRLGLHRFIYKPDFHMVGIRAGTSGTMAFATRLLRCFRLVRGGSITPSLIFPGPDDERTDFLWDLHPATGNPETAPHPITDKTRFIMAGPGNVRIGIPCPWGDDEIYVISAVVERQHAVVQVLRGVSGSAPYDDVLIDAASLARIVIQDDKFALAYSRGVRSILLQGPAPRRFVFDFHRELTANNRLDVAVYFPSQPLTLHSEGAFRRAEISNHGHWDVLSTTMPYSYSNSVVAELAQTAAIANWAYPEPRAIGPGGISVNDRFRAHKAVREAIRLSFNHNQGVLNVKRLLAYVGEQRLAEQLLICRAVIARLLADRSAPLRHLHAVELENDLFMPASILSMLGERLERIGQGRIQRNRDAFELTVPVRARRHPLPAESNAARTSSPFWPDLQRTPAEINLSDPFASWLIDRMARWLATKLAEGGRLVVRISSAGRIGPSTYRTSLELRQRVGHYLTHYLGVPDSEQRNSGLRIAYATKDPASTATLSVEDQKPASAASPVLPPSAVLRAPENGWCLLTSIAIHTLPPADHLRLLESEDYTHSESTAAVLAQTVRKRIQSNNSDETSSTLQHVLRNTTRARNAPGGPDAYLASVDDIDALKAAVAKWDDNWTGEFGEAFVHLVAHILRMPIRIYDIDHPEGEVIAPLGQPEAPEVSVWRDSDTHYDAWAPAISLSGPSLLLRSAVTADHNVYVIAGRKIRAPQSLMTDLIDASDGTLPVILLADPGTGGFANRDDVVDLNFLLEQFAQNALRPVVVTRSRPTPKLLDVAATYGLAVLHQVWNTPSGSGTNDNLQLAPWWQAVRLGPYGKPETPSISDSPWQKIDRPVLQAVAELARPDAAITPVDNPLGHMIWAPSLQETQEAFARLRRSWSPQHMKAAQAQLEQVSKRVPDDHVLSTLASVLEFGALGDFKTVFTYATARDDELPQRLMEAVAQIREVGQPGPPVADGLTTVALERMVTATCVNDISVPVLQLIGDIEAGRVTDAKAVITANRHKLTPESRERWVEAIAGLCKTRPHLHVLLDAIFDCVPERRSGSA
ncbi:OTU domain-containing protein [Micromonospora sp. DT4]|uniref:OTU domain-containing protein n=1 Tax=Micromonospora sp. DT4 TaxID=3393438 RepID=UPI003CF6EA0E